MEEDTGVPAGAEVDASGPDAIPPSPEQAPPEDASAIAGDSVPSGLAAKQPAEYVGDAAPTEVPSDAQPDLAASIAADIAPVASIPDVHLPAPQQPDQAAASAVLLEASTVNGLGDNNLVSLPPPDQQPQQLNTDGIAPNGDANSNGAPQEFPAPPPVVAAPATKRNRWGTAAVAITPAATGVSPSPGGEDGGDASERRKKRRSRWENDESQAIVVANVPGSQMVAMFPKEIMLTGGIRVALPQTITGEEPYIDPRLKQLHGEFNSLTAKLAVNDYDIPPEGQRSPSPEPMYDRNGQRLNTREIRARDKMTDRRNRVIEDLLKEDPTFKAPPDYKPRKYSNKVYIPLAEYPGYNFIGLIIGPRGNTQKRMQMETKTKIAIRGRGSVKEGSSKDPKYDYGEDEELHVMVTGETQEDVDNACNQLEKLMMPVDEAQNEHKRLQLRELALLNGTLKDEQICFLCGETTHRSTECPKTQAVEIYQLPAEIKARVDEQYQRDIARMQGTEGAVKLENEYASFLKELGGAPPPEYMGSDSSTPAPRMMASIRSRPGEDVPEECRLYVGNLSPVFHDKMLLGMFEPFGPVASATVCMDPISGVTKGFGFVHFENVEAAKAAAAGLNGKVVDGRALAVRPRATPGGANTAGLGAPRPPGGYAPPSQHDVPEDCKLYIGGMPPSANDAVVRSLFEQYGRVLECRTIMDRTTGQCKGYCFITMADSRGSQNARNALNGYKMDGKAISVKVASTPGSRDSRGDSGPLMSAVRNSYPPSGAPPGSAGRPAPPAGHPPPPGSSYPPPYGSSAAPPYPGAPPPGGQPGYYGQNAPSPGAPPVYLPQPAGYPPGPGSYPTPGGGAYPPQGPPTMFPGPGGAMQPNPYAVPPPNPYGAPTMPNPYGALPPNPFGAPPMPNPYGAPPPNPYGAPQQQQQQHGGYQQPTPDYMQQQQQQQQQQQGQQHQAHAPPPPPQQAFAPSYGQPGGYSDPNQQQQQQQQQQYGSYGGAPPLPTTSAPPLPPSQHHAPLPGQPPLPPSAADVQSEYDRFMSDLNKSFS